MNVLDPRTGESVPAEIAALAVGPDAYLRDLKAPCEDCGAQHTVRHLYHETDVPGSCSTCAAEFFKPCGCHPDDSCDCS